MASAGKIRVAVVGLGFGADFVPLYQAHPDVEAVAVCEPDERRRNAVGDRLGVTARFAELDEVLASNDWDAVHLLTPVPLHVEQTLAVLASGRHCACAVPMATSIEDLRRVIEAQQRAGRNTMMMETAVYTREFLYVQDRYRSGDMGGLTFLRGAHLQDLENYPDYWKAQPPMHYATHAVAPILALAGVRAAHVHCLGSGRLRPDIRQPGGNPFPAETAIFRLSGTENLAAEVTRSWFQVAREFSESFTVYGERLGFEWQQRMHEEPLLFTLEPIVQGRRGRPVAAERIAPPNRPDLLPPALHPFMNGGHGGSHPHLVHEFVRSIVEDRPPAINAARAADWCAPGICAHESALREGEAVEIPAFQSSTEGRIHAAGRAELDGD